MRPIVVVAPGYTHTSNGIACLHHLAHEINQLGGNARMMLLHGDQIFFSKDEQNNPAWNTPPLTPETEDLLKEAIVIYPEVIKGNPMSAARVVRWMGNKEGVLRDQKMDIQPTDFIVAHTKVIYPSAQHFLFYVNPNKCFNNHGVDPKKRILNATYIGKGHLYGDTGIIKDKNGTTIWIERTWPSTQEQLALLLQHVSCLYTWDCWTQTNVDAILCGAVPFFLRYYPFSSPEIDSTELGIIPRMDADHKDFNLGKFVMQRAQLIRRIEDLQKSWPARVKAFHDKLQEHFA